MSTTLAAARVELSKQLGDFWQGTTTSSGSSTTVVDTALMAKNNDWIDADNAEMYDLITSGTYDGQERRITALANSTGTLTTLAHGGTIASAVTYEVHRLFTPTEKLRALVEAARKIFPAVFVNVRSDSRVAANWLKNGDVDTWAVTTYPDSWYKSVTTLAETTTAGLQKGGTSVKMSTGAGYMAQRVDEVPDFVHLAGKTVTFSTQVWCDTASALRLAIYDGTTTTYSDYAAADSAWTENSNPLYVTYTFPTNAKDYEFRVYLDSAAATAYVSDLRVIGPWRNKIYIGDLGLYKNTPHRVSIEPATYTQLEPHTVLHNWEVDSDGYLNMRTMTQNYRIRIEGIKADEFTAQTAAGTVQMGQPQLDILVAQAAIDLCRGKMLPQFTPDVNTQWQQAHSFWQSELSSRKAKFSMRSPPATINWSGSTF